MLAQNFAQQHAFSFLSVRRLSKKLVISLLFFVTSFEHVLDRHQHVLRTCAPKRPPFFRPRVRTSVPSLLLV